MKLNHINLTVTDALEARQFLEKYFGLRTTNEAEDKRTFAVLFDDDGMVLTLIRGRRGTELKYPESFHIGFIVESEERVNEINRRLKEDGYEVDPPARLHGSWTFYFTAPGGFVIEVLC